MSAETDTPRTDAKVGEHSTFHGIQFVPAEFARHLEREVIKYQKMTIERGHGQICANAELTAAQSRIKELEANDRRYRWLTHRVKGARYPSGAACFALPDVKPVGDIFKGSVAQHLDAAIDSAMEKKS